MTDINTGVLWKNVWWKGGKKTEMRLCTNKKIAFCVRDCHHDLYTTVSSVGLCHDPDEQQGVYELRWEIKYDGDRSVGVGDDSNAGVVVVVVEQGNRQILLLSSVWYMICSQLAFLCFFFIFFCVMTTIVHCWAWASPCVVDMIYILLWFAVLILDFWYDKHYSTYIYIYQPICE